MIDLEALKEQLRLLGHDLPDLQVVAILKEMNIDFSEVTNNKEDAAGTSYNSSNERAGEKPASGPLRTGSILDNFDDRQQSLVGPHGVAASFGGASAQPAQSFQYEYTSPASGRPLGLHSNSASARKPTAADETSVEGSEDDGEDEEIEAEEPDVSCRYCTSAYQPSQRAAYGRAGADGVKCANVSSMRETWQGPTLTAAEGGFPGGDRGAPPQHHQESADISDHLRHMTLTGTTALPSRRVAMTAQNKASSNSAGMVAPAPLVRAQTQRPGSAIGTKDQMPKPAGGRFPVAAGRGYEPDPLEDEESDVALADPDKDPLGIGASSVHEFVHMQRQRAWMGQEAQKAGLPAAGSRARAPDTHAQGPYAGWLSGHHGLVHAHEADELPLRGQLSPQGSQRSFMSRASTRASTGSKGGAKKVDRVQRYQQLQAEWSQNRFLKQGSGTTKSTTRKPVNFHNHFASLHATEEAERQRMLREVRARTKKELGAATEAPTANRRDELRWQTRMRLKNQT